MSIFHGVFTALVTPFRGGELDEGAFKVLVERQIAGGVHGLIPVGTTGESPTLTIDEHWRMFDLTIGVAAGRIPVVAGCGSNDTATAIRHLKRAKEVGADGALVVAPYYNKPSQEGLYAHFTALADAVDIPIMLYNVPGRTSVDIQPATVARIAAHPNVVALKDSAGDPSRTALHRALCPPELALFCGDDALAMGFAAYGAVGVVSVLSNLMPRETARLQTLLAAGDYAAARTLNQTLDRLQRALFLDPNPVPVKYALAQLGLCSDEVRLPLVGASASTRAAVDAAMAQAGAGR
jgi:4-hydroxy-tetrahydrodipicolinate synthase